MGGVSAGVTGACTEACYIFTNHGEGVWGEHRRGEERGGETDSGQNQNQAEYNSELTSLY